METTKGLINCRVCNIEFKPKSKKTKYCGQKCAGIGFSLDRKKLPIICPGCKNEFIPIYSKTKYCCHRCYSDKIIPHENSLKNLIHDKPPKWRPWDGGKRMDFVGDKHPMFGKKHTEEAILKIKAKRALQILDNRGEKHGQWKGGISKLRERLHMSKPHIEWVRAVLKRENYTCQHCGKRKREKELNNNFDTEVHHIKSFKDIRDEFNIKTFEEALCCAQMWDVNNGLTLCRSCHTKTENYGNKKNKNETI